MRSEISKNPSADEVYVRIDKATANGVELVIYKDSRFDVAKLDELYTPTGWRMSSGIDEQSMTSAPKVFAEIEIWDSDHARWVSRKDYGDDPVGSIKALVSDAVKRASFRFGIGAALYTAPKIFIRREDCALFEADDRSERYFCRDRFVVDLIDYSEDGKRIERLLISSLDAGRVVFEFDATELENSRKQRIEAYEAAKAGKAAKAEKKPARAKAAPKTEAPAPVKETVAPVEEAPAPTTAPDPAVPVDAAPTPAPAPTPEPKAEKPKAKIVEPRKEAATPITVKKEETPVSVKPAPARTPAMSIQPPENHGPEWALETLSDAGSKKGQPLKNLRPAEMQLLLARKADCPDEIRNAIIAIAAETDAVLNTLIKRGYGEEAAEANKLRSAS